MEDMELRIGDLFAMVLRKWRVLMYVGIAAAIVLGAGTAVLRLLSINNPEMQEKWQTEYESKYSAYWAEIHDVDYQIQESEYAIVKAEADLENLAWLDEKYQMDINKIEDNISIYELQRQDLEKNIEAYQNDKEEAEYLLKWRLDQNANSLYMAIDPYDVQTAEAYVRVDANYQIIPGSMYQNPNQTGELLERYQLMVSSAAFYEKMIADLQLETEVRYLTEVLSIGKYNDNSLRVKIIGTESMRLQRIVEYICDSMLAHHDEMAAAVKAHTVEVYGQRSYSVVNMGVYETQQANLQDVTTRENTIRQLEIKSLDAQAQIRQVDSAIRQYAQDIKEIEQAIENLPQKESNLRQEVNLCNDMIAQMRLERLELLEKDEPQYGGYTAFNILTGFVKFAIIGGVVGVLLAAVWLVLSKVFGGKVLSAQQVSEFANVVFFGVWPEETKKKPLAFIDGWVNVLTKALKRDKELVCANVVASTREHSRVLLCGGADVERIRNIATEIGERYPALQLVAAGSVASDAKAVEGLDTCNAVILVEEIYESDLSAVQEVIKRAKAVEKPVLGIVIV